MDISSSHSLYLYMSGEWELLMSMSTPAATTGTTDDSATASLTVP